MGFSQSLDYFNKFNSIIKQQAEELTKHWLAEFPELELVTKYNSPFFVLRSNGWSVFNLIYVKDRFKIGFVNDAAMDFWQTKRHEKLSGTEHQQSILFEVNRDEDLALVEELIGDAIKIQLSR